MLKRLINRRAKVRFIQQILIAGREDG